MRGADAEEVALERARAGSAAGAPIGRRVKRGAGRSLRGVAALISARKPHGMLQVLWLEELDVDADVFR